MDTFTRRENGIPDPEDGQEIAWRNPGGTAGASSEKVDGLSGKTDY
jgi:hypothetical protein